MIVVGIRISRREKDINGRPSVRRSSSECSFLWSRYQKGGLNGRMHSSPWNGCANVIDKCVVVLNRTSRDRHSISSRVIDAGCCRGRRGGNTMIDGRIMRRPMASATPAKTTTTATTTGSTTPTSTATTT